MQLIGGQMCDFIVIVFFIKRRRMDQVKLELRVLELEGQINMEEMCF